MTYCANSGHEISYQRAILHNLWEGGEGEEEIPIKLKEIFRITLLQYFFVEALKNLEGSPE